MYAKCIIFTSTFEVIGELVHCELIATDYLLEFIACVLVFLAMFSYDYS